MAKSSISLVRLSLFTDCAHHVLMHATVKTYDLRSNTRFNFGSDFARLRNWPLYQYPVDEDNKKETSLSEKVLVAFCSINFWVKNASGSARTLNTSANPNQTNVSFNLIDIGVLI